MLARKNCLEEIFIAYKYNKLLRPAQQLINPVVGQVGIYQSTVHFSESLCLRGFLPQGHKGTVKKEPDPLLLTRHGG